MMRPSTAQIATVTCLVDLGYTQTSIWRDGHYERTYPVILRLLATHGSLSDVLYDGMPDHERDLSMIVAEWMQNVYTRRIL